MKKKNIATWCLVTLRLHRCGFKTAEQDTKSTRPSTVGSHKVTPSPEYPRPCLMSCITPPSAALSGRAWWPSMATLTVSGAFAFCDKQMHYFYDFSFLFVDYLCFLRLTSLYSARFLILLFVFFFRSSLLCPDLSEPPSPGHVAAPASPQPLALHRDPPDLWPPDPDPPSRHQRPLPTLTRRSSLEKRQILHTGAPPTRTQKRKAEKRPFFCPSGGQEYPTCSQSPDKAFILSRNSQTKWFTPPKGPILLQVYSVLHSAHPPSDRKVEGVFWKDETEQGSRTDVS